MTISPENLNHAIALGRVTIDRSPLRELEHLRASIGYSPAIGWFIPVSEDDKRRIDECIAFNRGRG